MNLLLLLLAAGLITAAGAPALERPALREAVFAGGCFWCMQPPYDTTAGVLSTRAGYTGGVKTKPTYKEVSAGGTGHTEAVQVIYDPALVSYERLLEIFWHNIDPYARDRQFCDVGSQYRAAIFYRDEEQRRLAEASRVALERSGRMTGPIVTQIEPAGTFWPAEEYHQAYYKKNPIRYKLYRTGCGRDARLKEIWGRDAGGAGPTPP